MKKNYWRNKFQESLAKVISLIKRKKSQVRSKLDRLIILGNFQRKKSTAETME